MKKNGKTGDLLFGQVIALVGCVLFPGLVSAIAPVSWIHLKRSSGSVSAQTKTCVFFLIPYQTQKVEGLQSTDDRIRRGTISRNNFEKSRTRSEDEGFLSLVGESGTAEVSVSPASLRHVKERIEAFLQQTELNEQTLFTVANWKFGFLMAGALSTLTVLYIVGVCLSILNLFRKSIGLTG